MTTQKATSTTLLLALSALILCGHPATAQPRPIPRDVPAGATLAERVVPPAGFERLDAAEGSFGAWLRRLPLHPGRPPVHLYDGARKANQGAHHAVLDIDVGRRDLQQCADAVMRLRAEYLLARGCGEAIAFRFTSGDLASWQDWQRGLRPRVRGSEVTWHESASPDASYESFRRYLDIVFTYAGSASLARELEAVADPTRVRAGDVFIQGGYPGHAVAVVDVAENAAGERVFLLVQSYMPAQQIHLLKNMGSPLSPWYEARPTGELMTPEWRFRYSDLRRFPAAACGAS